MELELPRFRRRLPGWFSSAVWGCAVVLTSAAGPVGSCKFVMGEGVPNALASLFKVPRGAFAGSAVSAVAQTA